MSRIFRVAHRSTYRYDAAVTESHGEVRMLPRGTHRQSVRSSSVMVHPGPENARERTDWFGNRVVSFAVHEPHDTLVVACVSEVEVRDDLPSWPEAPVAWEEAVRRLQLTVSGLEVGGGAVLDARQYVLESPFTGPSASLRTYAEASFGSGRPLVDAVADLSARIHRDFRYEPGSTAVDTPPDEVLVRRAGVCQDFSHVAIGALRSMGLAARYVSGYLETDPPPGRPKLTGSDVSHAWFSVFVPGQGWLDLDPTNDCVAGERHITTAWGRDYGDVTPLKGVIFSDARRSDLEVEVDVTAVG